MSHQRQPRILIVGPVRGAGGMATCIRLQLDSTLRDHADLVLLDNSKRTRPDRPLWRGVVSQLKLLIRFVGLLLFKRPDIVHIHTCSGPTFFRNSIDFALAKLLLTKVAWHIHGARFDAFLSGLKGVGRWWCTLMLTRADAVIVLGTNWQRVVRCFCPPARTKIIENGIAIPPLPVRSTNAVPRVLRVLFVGDLSERKGVDDLIAASMAAHPDHQLRIIGGDVENRLAETKKRVATQTNHHRIEFLGTLEPAQVATELAAADVFVLPSYAEGLPMAMLEAMAVGVPVVMTTVGAIPEVIVDGQNGFMVEPGDVKALRRHLETLIEDAPLRERIGRHGLETVRDRFGYDRVARQLADLYAELVPAVAAAQLQPS